MINFITEPQSQYDEFIKNEVIITCPNPNQKDRNIVGRVWENDRSDMWIIEISLVGRNHNNLLFIYFPAGEDKEWYYETCKRLMTARQISIDSEI